MNKHLKWIKFTTDYRTENESKNWITWQWWRKNHQQRCDLRWKYPKDQAMNLCKKSGVGEVTVACSPRKSRRERRDGNRHLDELLLWNETHAFLFVMSCWMSKKRKIESVCVCVSVTCLGLEIPVFSPLFVRTSRRSSTSPIAESEIVLFFWLRFVPSKQKYFTQTKPGVLLC